MYFSTWTSSSATVSSISGFSSGPSVGSVTSRSRMPRSCRIFDMRRFFSWILRIYKSTAKPGYIGGTDNFELWSVHWVKRQFQRKDGIFWLILRYWLIHRVFSSTQDIYRIAIMRVHATWREMFKMDSLSERLFPKPNFSMITCCSLTMKTWSNSSLNLLYMRKMASGWDK